MTPSDKARLSWVILQTIYPGVLSFSFAQWQAMCERADSEDGQIFDEHGRMARRLMDQLLKDYAVLPLHRLTDEQMDKRLADIREGLRRWEGLG